MNKIALTPEELKAIGVRNEFIGRWGTDTISTFERTIKTDRRSDRLCITTLSVCSTYCNAINAILLNGLRMPSKALLRILFEVSARVLWCLAQRTPDEPESAVEERIKAWAKNSFVQDISLRKGYLTVVSEEDRATLTQSIKDSEEQLKRWECDPMPKKFFGLLQTLGDLWQGKFYAHLYLRFNDAIHLDIGSLCGKATDDGVAVSVVNDSGEPIEELAKYWAFTMLTIFVVIRSHYGWDIETMRAEYRAINQPGDA